FLQNTGYFDRAADLLPLLHMWSLSVEEQFYLVWPPLLAAFFFIARKEAAVIAALVGAVVIGGLWLSVQRTGTDPKSAFFLAHLRAWELALGALLVFLPPLRKSVSRWKNELPTIIGVGLIAISVLTLSREHLFPGLAAVPACVGAALIIWPRASDSIVGQMLSVPAVRFIGLISYSLYLWHWPVLVFYRHYASGAAPTLLVATALAAASILFGYFLLALYRPARTPAPRQAVHDRGLRPCRRIDRCGCRAGCRCAARISGETVAGRPRHEQPGGNVEMGVSAAREARWTSAAIVLRVRSRLVRREDQGRALGR